jgi:DNA polymerase III alpha subunit
MRIDNLGIPVFSSSDVFDLLYQGKLDILPKILTEPNDAEVKQFNEHSETITLQEYQEPQLSKTEFDSLMQSSWNMPDKYKTLDIEEWLSDSCPEQNFQRLVEELEAYKARNMLDLLRWLKYFVDTCRKEGIVWGVGRGSSVASYVLYLIGVHKIDSLKYNLDWREFLR